jgi:ABC-type uncharacterized transport system permease subunit
MAVPEETVKVMSSSIAPVFLISGIGVLLSAMTVRYGRVIDRVRVLLNEVRDNPSQPVADDVMKEMRYLYKRAHQLRATIILAATSIFCIVLAIVLIFAMLMFKFAIPLAAEILFIASLAFLLLSVGFFIEDFAISLRVLKLEINSKFHKKIF